MSQRIVSGHFVEGSKGPIFVLARRPAGPTTGCVLVVPAFAEEMNKTRRMITEVSLGLAERGVATLVPDLYGTGDSGGDFADGDWPTWQDDLRRAVRWAAQQDLRVTGMLGVRLGCALAASAASAPELTNVSRVALWQPVFDGPRFLAQFLRIRTAAALMEADRRETADDLRKVLAAGETVTVAGYSLSSRLAADIQRLLPPEPFPHWRDLQWMEVNRQAPATVPLPSTRLIERIREAGCSVTVEVFDGEPFWTSTEIVRIPAMIESTVQFLVHHATGRS